MCQVDRERMLAAEAEEAQHGVFGIDTGEKTLLPAADRLAEGSTEQKPTEAGEDWKIIAPRKNVTGAQTDRKEKIHGDGDCLKPKAEGDKGGTDQRKRPSGQPLKQGIEHHA